MNHRPLRKLDCDQRRTRAETHTARPAAFDLSCAQRRQVRPQRSAQFIRQAQVMKAKGNRSDSGSVIIAIPFIDVHARGYGTFFSKKVRASSTRRRASTEAVPGAGVILTA